MKRGPRETAGVKPKGWTKTWGKAISGLAFREQPTGDAAALLDLNEAFADALANRQIHWCRAKLLHALAGAADQGILNEVLDEIFGDMHRSDNLHDDVQEEMLKYLKENGWSKTP